MFNIQKFLEKFSKKIHSTELYQKQIAEIIQKQTQINISTKDIEIKDYIVYIKSSPAVKNKLFIYKQSILEEVENFVPIKIIDLK